MDPTLETVLETVATTIETTVETIPPAPTVPPIQPVMVVNDFAWLTHEFNKLADINQIIIGFLLFFTLCILLRAVYKFFRIFF